MTTHLFGDYVFPARAGMIRVQLQLNADGTGIPRESGDDPCSASGMLGQVWYSPRERG